MATISNINKYHKGLEINNSSVKSSEHLLHQIEENSKISGIVQHSPEELAQDNVGYRPPLFHDQV